MKRSITRTIPIIAALLFAATTLVPARQAERRFGLDDFSRVARVSDPQFAPDGRSIAVVISRPNLDANRYDPELTIIDVAGGTTRTLVAGMPGLAGARWSPDGNALAFLASAAVPAQLQIFVVPSKGGTPKQITTAPRGAQHLAWSPDSKTIAFAAQDDADKREGFERHNLSFEITPTTNYTMTSPLLPTHVWMVPAAGGAMKRLTSGTWTLPVSRPPGPPSSMLAWTKDGTGIAFARQGGAPAGPGGGGGVQVVKIADGSMAPLAGVNGTFPQFAPVGDAILAMAGSNAVVVPAPGGTAKNLTQAIDRGIARATWMPDAKSVLVGGNDTERVSMWMQPVEGGDAKKIDAGDLSPNSSYYVDWSVSKDGAIAFSATSPTRPAELYLMTSPTASPKRLTDVNGDLARLPLGKTDTVEWKSDDFTENGMLTYPPDFTPTKKYPLVLLIHGGPRAASMRTFSPAAQLMAAKGWLVFQPNYRGSDNMGSKFQGAIRNDAGEGPGRDVVAGIEMLKARGFVDDTRMAVSGWSYGGYMTTWMLGHYPTLWKAAVTGASVTSQLDQYNLSDGAGGPRGNNSPWINPQVMERMRDQSPITNASKIKAPTLILHNVGDYRVTITQSYNLYHALIDAGTTTQFVAYPISGHNALDPVHQRDVQRRWIGWFEKYLN